MKITVGEVEVMIQNQMPSNDSLFAQSVNSGGIERNKPWWTGWKAAEAGQVAANKLDSEIVEVSDGPIGYVGQWVCFVGPSNTEIITLSVNLPDMNCEKLGNRPKFNAGTERVYCETPVEDLERLIEAGYHKLMELVAQEKPKAA